MVSSLSHRNTCFQDRLSGNWLVWFCFRTGKHLVSTFFPNGKIDTSESLVAAWHQDEQQEERGKRVLYAEKWASQHLGKPLCRSQKCTLHILAFFPPNYIFPVSFPTASVGGHGAHWLMVVQLQLLSLPLPATKEVLPGLGEWKERQSAPRLSEYVAHLPGGGYTEDASAQVLNQGLVLAGSVVRPAKQGRGYSSYPLASQSCVRQSITAHDGSVRSPEK